VKGWNWPLNNEELRKAKTKSNHYENKNRSKATAHSYFADCRRTAVDAIEHPGTAQH
jgi:hypothetical protein